MSKDSILVIEESSVLSDLIRDLLEATGFKVIQAFTSKDGLALFEEQAFGAILVDADMPELSGAAIIEEMKGNAASATPTLLITSDQSEESLPKGITPRECLRKPIDPVELITRVRTAAGKEPTDSGASNGHVASASAPAPETHPVVPRTPGQAKIITVFSLKGGVGTSTIAVNLAVALQEMWNEATALVDLSLEAGALNILLDILPSATLDELVSANGNMTAETVSQHMVAHKSGVSLLSAPPSPERAELIDGASLRKAMTFIKGQFDYVVIDTASTFAEHTLMALEMADLIVLPLIGDISSIRATTTALDIFQALSIPEERVLLVFNEIFPKMGLSRKHAETSMNVTTVPLPYGGAKLIDSVNLGAPIVTSAPDNPFAQAVKSLAEVVSHPDSSQLSRPKSGDLFSRVRSKLKA